MKKFLALSISDVVFIMLINVKMSIIIGTLTFMSKINFVLSCVEHEKCFIASEPGFGSGPYDCVSRMLQRYNRTNLLRQTDPFETEIVHLREPIN